MFPTNLLFACVFLKQFLTVLSTLVYPTSTVLQMAAAISVPIDLSGIKAAVDWGFIANYNLPFSLENFYKPSIWPGVSKAQARSIGYNEYIQYNGTHPSDLTAGQIYQFLEEVLIGLGFHETCLLKSVCEVAKHPFDLEEENLLAEILNFVLSPSLHNSFGEDEQIYKHAYEAAEKYGASDVDCHYLYPECTNAVINLITRVAFD